MCELCYSSVSLWEYALVGWHLGRAESTGRRMRVGQYALFRSDAPMEPSFVWDDRPEPDPDPEDTLGNPPIWQEWAERAARLEAALVGPTLDSWRLVEAARKSGWKLDDPHQRHPRFAHWLFDALGREIQGKEPVSTIGQKVDEIGEAKA